MQNLRKKNIPFINYWEEIVTKFQHNQIMNENGHKNGKVYLIIENKS